MEKSRRIAAFGGTFDPIHNGHVEVARAVVRTFSLDSLLIVPASRPPHKGSRPISGSYHRYAMAVIASLDEPRVSVSTIELDEPGRPYTFDTIARLKEELGPRTKIFFVVGADSFEDINSWREPARLLASTSLIVAARPGHEMKSTHLDEWFRDRIVDLRDEGEPPDAAMDANDHRIYLTNCVSTDVSSTEIRRKVRDGEPIEDQVPARVAAYIRKYKLYREPVHAS